ncbi:MAG: MerR family transcriptional regulator [Deltaproteobacteria bacterium]|jgi:DNA-binding transcriptional MerR regulator|nr:MerR family transcriptional regulator [Deltaproteobacteria bacterium]
MYSIGKLAALSGAKAVTVRFYEKSGLLASPKRLENGYRSYSEGDLETLRFIRHTRGHGFTLDEVKELLALRAAPEASCGLVDAIAARHVEKLDERLKSVASLRDQLLDLQSRCPPGGKASECAVLRGLMDPSACPCGVEWLPAEGKYNIGKLASLAGTKAGTVRYYERAGLMKRPERQGNGFRRYSARDLERLRFIRHCRSHGFTQEETKELLALREAPEASCGLVDEMADRHVAKLDEEIRSLNGLRGQLVELMNRCPKGGTVSECAIMRGLMDPSLCPCGGAAANSGAAETPAAGRDGSGGPAESP